EAMDLSKLELLVGGQCRGAVMAASVNGNTTYGAFATNTDGLDTVTTWKLPRLGLTQAQVAARGLALCLTLAPPCAALSDFCLGGGACRHAFLNSAESCCPTGDSLFTSP
ncbi:hypothetical protein HYH03_019021, partial [Edaphochlamys debaryana]